MADRGLGGHERVRDGLEVAVDALVVAGGEKLELDQRGERV